EEILQVKSKTEKPELQRYYEEVCSNFRQRLDFWRANLPEARDARQQVLTGRLELLNNSFAKADYEFAIDLYTHFKELASLIAQASGGILGMASISDMEREFVKLPMLTTPQKS